MSISARYSEDSNEATICIDGVLDFDGAMEFREAYGRSEWRTAAVTVDLTACQYLDSAALGALLLMKSALAKADGEVVIKTGDSEVSKILAAVHFEKKFTII